MNYQALIEFLSKEEAVSTFTIFYPVDPANESQTKFCDGIGADGLQGSHQTH